MACGAVVLRSVLSFLALAVVVPLSARAYSSTSSTADHTAAAISFAEEGDMDRAILSFRAAAKFAPAVPEHWYNLGTALQDEDYAGASRGTIVREAQRALRRADSLRRNAATPAPAAAARAADGAESGAQDDAAERAAKEGVDSAFVDTDMDMAMNADLDVDVDVDANVDAEGPAPAQLAQVCARGHPADGVARQLCLRAARTLSSHCNVPRVDARDASAHRYFMDSVRSGTPLILSSVRPLPAPAQTVAGMTRRARTDAIVSTSQAGALPARKAVAFHKFLKQMRRSQRKVVRAAARNATVLPQNNDLRYIFPGSPITEFFPRREHLRDTFGDTRVTIGGVVRFDHAHGGSVMNVNGAFMGLPFHSHTSVLHEVVVGAKHFMFYIGNDTRPPFGVGSAHDHRSEPESRAARLFDYNVHQWVHDGRAMPDAATGALEPSPLPTFECTLLPSEAIFVPFASTHATYNLVPTLSLVRSGCNGMIPSLRKEVLDRTCPGPPPPDGRGAWSAVDFLEEPPEDVPHAKHPHLIVKAKAVLDGTRSNRDLRLQFLVFADATTRQGMAMLAKAEKVAKQLAAQHQDSLPTPPWVWVHVPDCRACAAHADMCGDFYIDARVLFVDSPAKLGVGGKVSLKAARRFLKKLGGSELRQLANRLQVLNED